MKLNINNIDMKWQKGKKETLMKSLPNRDGRFKDICSGSKPQMGKNESVSKLPYDGDYLTEQKKTLIMVDDVQCWSKL